MGWLDLVYYKLRSLGTDLPLRPAINFGSGFTLADNPTTHATDVTLSGGGGGGGFTPPTGTGMMTTTAGAMNPAATVLGSGVPVWLTAPSSANLLAAMTDKSGTGLALFGTSPTVKTSFVLRNPADTFSYVFTPGAIVASRVLNLPTLGADDTMVTEAHAQTLTNKTIDVASNTLTATSGALGDLLVHNGTKYVRLARGTANQVLTVNGGGTDIAWAAASGGGSVPTGTGIPHIVSGSQSAAASLIVDADVHASAGITASKLNPDMSGIAMLVGSLQGKNENFNGSGTINNQAIAATTTIFQCINAGGVNFTGFSGGNAGRFFILVNLTGAALTVYHQDAASSAANRVEMPYASNLVMADRLSILFYYDGYSARWRPVYFQ